MKMRIQTTINTGENSEFDQNYVVYDSAEELSSHGEQTIHGLDDLLRMIRIIHPDTSSVVLTVTFL